MHQRESGFFQFFGKYPEAERHENIHEDGSLSTFGVGLFQGVVNEGYLAVHKKDGSLRFEQVFNDDEMAQGLGQRTVSLSDALSYLMRLAVDKNGAVAKQV